MSNQHPTQKCDGTEIETTIRCAANRLIHKFGFDDQEADDLLQDLRLTAFAALQWFDPQKAKLVTYIRDCVENRCFNILRDRQRQCRDRHRHHQAPQSAECDDKEVSRAPDEREEVRITATLLEDRRASGEVDRTLLRIDVSAVLATLTQRQQVICQLLVDNSPSEITQILGCSHRQVYGDVTQIRLAFVKAGFATKSTTPGKEWILTM